MEHPDRNPQPFREILAPQTDIKFTDDGDTYRTYEDFAAWIAGPVSSLPATRHAIGPIQYSELADGRYELVVSFDWQGLRADEQRMTAKTTHRWVVTNDPSERFARIEKVCVDIVELFAIAK